MRSVESVIKVFDREYMKCYPEEEIRYIKENWSEFLPLIEEEMHRFVKKKGLKYDHNFLHFGVYLLADMEEKGSYPLLLDMLCSDDECGDRLETVFGDGITEDIPSIVYQLSNGDWVSLINALSKNNTYQFVQSGLLDVLYTLYVDGKVSKDSLFEPINELLHLSIDNNKFEFVINLGAFIIFIGFDQFRETYQKLVSSGYFDEHVRNNYFTLSPENDPMVLKCLKNWKLDFQPHIVSDSVGVKCLDTDWFYGTPPNFVSEQPYVNIAKIGRNDPCFCGSGKKYKKCCLQ